MNILALDPATKTGWAHSWGPSGVWDFSIQRDESSGMRLLRFRSKLTEIHAEIGIDLVAYEAARHAAPKMQGALTHQARLQAIIEEFCEDRSIEYKGYSPAAIKKHATGSGKASKDDMIAAAQHRWPEVDVLSDDHADALWLLNLAEHSFGKLKESA